MHRGAIFGILVNVDEMIVGVISVTGRSRWSHTIFTAYIIRG